MNSPLISVIMCSFNTSEDFLTQAVKSILNQTFSNFELIVIDDGSSFFPRLEDFDDSRIRVIHNDTNKGISFSRNLGLSLARGKYIAIMDSDDIAEPDRLQYEFDFLESEPKCVACGTWFRQFGEKNNVCMRVIDDSSLYKARLLFGNAPTLLDPSSMIRKSVIFENQIQYDETLKSGMDYLMWVRLTEIGEIHNVKSVLMNYRTHSGQITKQGYKYQDLSTISYQFKKIGITLNDKQKKMLLEPLNSKNYTLKEYRTFLDTILVSNENLNYFKQDSLKKAVEYQWHKKILHSKNVIYLLKGFFTIKKYKKSIIKSFLRHFGLFKSLDRIADGAN